MKSFVVVVALILTLGFVVPHSSHAQSRTRVAVQVSDTVQSQTYGVGQRATDQLISALAGNTSFEVIDREHLAEIMREQNQSYTSRFDAAGAAKLGKLANAGILIIGQIDGFSADVTNESKQTVLGNKVTQNGVVDLRVAVRVIQVETGAILGAPSVESEQKAVLAQSSDHSHLAAVPYVGLVTGAGAPAYAMSAQPGGGRANGGIQKLVDQAVSDAISQLAQKINAMALSAPVPAVTPKFVGIENGLVVVNKGHNSGVKVGDKFEVTRITESSLIDPDTISPSHTRRSSAYLQ